VFCAVSEPLHLLHMHVPRTHQNDTFLSKVYRLLCVILQCSCIKWS